MNKWTVFPLLIALTAVAGCTSGAKTRPLVAAPSPAVPDGATEFRQGMIAFRGGDFARAEAAFTQAERRASAASRDDLAHAAGLLAGESALRAGDIAVAFRHANREIARQPDFGGFYIQGRAHVARRDIEAAEAAFASAVSFDGPARPKTRAEDYLHFCRALRSYRQAAIAEARRHLDHIASADLKNELAATLGLDTR